MSNNEGDRAPPSAPEDVLLEELGAAVRDLLRDITPTPQGDGGGGGVVVAETEGQVGPAKAPFLFDFGSASSSSAAAGRVCCAIEQVILMGLKEDFSFFGPMKKKDYVELLQQSGNIKMLLGTDSSLPKAKTQRGKGRATIMYALFSKQLVDTLCTLSQASTLVSEWYDLQSVFCSTTRTALLLKTLQSLDTVNFMHDQGKLLAYLQQTDFDCMPTVCLYKTTQNPPEQLPPETQTLVQSTPDAKVLAEKIEQTTDTEEVKSLKLTIQQLKQALQHSQNLSIEKTLCDAKIVAEAEHTRKKAADHEKSISLLQETLSAREMEVETLKQKLLAVTVDPVKVEAETNISSKQTMLEMEATVLKQHYEEACETIAKMKIEENSSQRNIAALSKMLEAAQEETVQQKREILHTQGQLKQTQEKLAKATLVIEEKAREQEMWAKERGSMPPTENSQNIDTQMTEKTAQSHVEGSERSQHLLEQEKTLTLLKHSQEELGLKDQELTTATHTIDDLTIQLKECQLKNQNLSQILSTQTERIEHLEHREVELSKKEGENKKLITELQEKIEQMNGELKTPGDVEQTLSQTTNELHEAKQKIFDLTQEVTSLKMDLDVVKVAASLAKSDLLLQKELVRASKLELEDAKTHLAAEKQCTSKLATHLEIQQKSAQRLEEVVKQSQENIDQIKADFRHKEELVEQLQEKLKTIEHADTLAAQCKRQTELAEGHLAESNMWKAKCLDLGNELAKTTSVMGDFSAMLSSKDREIEKLKNEICLEQEKAKKEKSEITQSFEDTRKQLSEYSESLLRLNEEHNSTLQKLQEFDLATKSMEAEFQKKFAEQVALSSSLQVQVATIAEQMQERETELKQLLELSEQQVASLGDQAELQAQALAVASSTCQELKEKLETAHTEINERNSTIHNLLAKLEGSVTLEKHTETQAIVRQLELTVETLQNKAQLYEEEVTHLKQTLSQTKEMNDTYALSLQKVSKLYEDAVIAAAERKSH
ncbi:hypothetical protein Pelo_13591 [Pelomyxa schiedti]|nr:hypothetical protein Pelo_13591 [Pelomyxa schiedti]